MVNLPQRQTLSTQVAKIIKEEISKGYWTSWLPSERHLSIRYNVSRNTLRSALKLLIEEQVVDALHGTGHKIRRKPLEEEQSKPFSIGLLAPRPISHLRPSSALWIDALRATLFKQGLPFEVHYGRSYFSKRAAASLRVLTTRYDHNCWILLLSTPETQNWFYRSGIPSIIAGTCHPNIKLPSVDIDQQAQCRHAAGIMLSKGHRRLAFIHSSGMLAGDIESEKAFLETVASTSNAKAKAAILQFNPSSRSDQRAFRQMFTGEEIPTAVLIANPYLYLTCFSMLCAMGLRIPEDVSLISRDNEEFLTHLRPVPSRYIFEPNIFADKIADLIRELFYERKIPLKHVKLIPEFEQEASLADLNTKKDRD